MSAVVSQLEWRHLADLAIVALFAYQLLRLVRGTRAGQMLLGLSLLGMAYAAARWWQLPTLQWLFDGLTPYLVIGALILFQPEIRRGLTVLGALPFLRRALTRPGGPYEDVVLAVRRTSLRTHIESGVPLEAKLSYDLLVSIFLPGAPLHDGAAIVQKDRVAAAACFLPLSVHPERPRELGSRHRAALGIAEDTDAVVVAVSEMTGAISLAVEGKIYPVTEDQLRERLRELFGRRVAVSTAAVSTPVEAPFSEPRP